MKVNELKQLMCEIAQNNGFDFIYEKTMETDALDPVRIAFLGEFSTGKSTLINALLKDNVLPMYDTPTNAAIVEISKADDNRIEVIRTVDGKEETAPISPYQLAQEVMTGEDGKLVKIFRNDLDFLSEDMIIVDTPGVSSMHDVHTDVTCGYLPFIDAAVIMISAASGDVTASLLDFIKNMVELVEGLKNRLFFCITMLDLLLEDERVKVYEQIKKNLGNAIPSARILMISPNQILDHALQNRQDEYDKSNISSIIDFIKIEIPNLSKEIRDQKQCRALKEIKGLLINELKLRMTSLDYSFPELDQLIISAQTEIKAMQSSVSKLNNDYEDILSSITQLIDEELGGLIDIIAHKASKEEDYTGDIDAFADNVKEIINHGICKLNLPSGHGVNNLGELIDARVSPVIDRIISITNLIADAITVVISIFLIPGKTVIDAAGAGAVAAQKAAIAAQTGTEVIQKSIFIKLFGGLGKVLKAINPVEKLKDIIQDLILRKTIENELNSAMFKILNGVFDAIKNELDEYIELHFTNPISQRFETLKRTKETKEKEISNLDSIKAQIREQISSISINDC